MSVDIPGTPKQFESNSDAEKEAAVKAIELKLSRSELRSIREFSLAEAVRYYQSLSGTLGIEDHRSGGDKIVAMANKFEEYLTGGSSR
jgi:hypothetical protein